MRWVVLGAWCELLLRRNAAATKRQKKVCVCVWMTIKKKRLLLHTQVASKQAPFPCGGMEGWREEGMGGRGVILPDLYLVHAALFL